LTRKPDGVLLYNGPIVPPEPEEQLISDFISLELVRAHPRLLIDFGSGTLELRIETKNGLDDGDWHRVDIFWDREEVRFQFQKTFFFSSSLTKRLNKPECLSPA
jgi:Laminin G domain